MRMISMGDRMRAQLEQKNSDTEYLQHCEDRNSNWYSVQETIKILRRALNENKAEGRYSFRS